MTIEASPTAPGAIRHPKAKARRDALRAAGICINGGPRSRVVHGDVVSAGKCQRCIDVHKGALIPEHPWR